MQHRLVEVGAESESGEVLGSPLKDRYRRVVIAGTPHSLQRSERREDLRHVYNRDRDAEHMVSRGSLPVDFPEVNRMARERLEERGFPEPEKPKHISVPSYEHRPYPEVREYYEQLGRNALLFDETQLKQRMRILDRLHERSPEDLNAVIESILFYRREFPKRLEPVYEKLTYNPRNEHRLAGYTAWDLVTHLSSSERQIKENELNEARHEPYREAYIEWINKQLNPEIETILEEHVIDQQGVYNIIRNEGVIRATHASGDPDVNEGMLAYTSYGPYYRRGSHTYGFILDLPKMLDTIPGITATIHHAWGMARTVTGHRPR